MAVLDVQNLDVVFHGKRKLSHLVKHISFSVEHGECLCILGESGSGKSMTMKAVMGLLDSTFTVTGNAFLAGEDLCAKSGKERRNYRGTKMSMILQNPMNCFDSLYRIDYQIKETLLAHTILSDMEIQRKAIAALEKMQINSPEEVLKKYPHQLSGGMLQRIMIAIALMLQPMVLIADEPTTAIDAITQFEIMKEFQRLKENHTTMIFITHDLGIASLIADKVIVLNQGEIVDTGTFADVVNHPKDSYTKLLVEKRKAVMARYQAAMRGESYASR